MSKRRKKSEPMSPELLEAKVRESLGGKKYAPPKAKYPTTRRLKCDQCGKTWKFSDKLNFSPCPSCKKGRLS